MDGKSIMAFSCSRPPAAPRYDHRDGTDERDAVDALATLVESGFSEDVCSA